MEEAKEDMRPFAKKQKQTRFQNKKGNMVMIPIKKCQFRQLSDKSYIPPDGYQFTPLWTRRLILY